MPITRSKIRLSDIPPGIRQAVTGEPRPFLTWGAAIALSASLSAVQVWSWGITFVLLFLASLDWGWLIATGVQAVRDGRDFSAYVASTFEQAGFRDYDLLDPWFPLAADFNDEKADE